MVALMTYHRLEGSGASLDPRSPHHWLIQTLLGLGIYRASVRAQVRWHSLRLCQPLIIERLGNF